MGQSRRLAECLPRWIVNILRGLHVSLPSHSYFSVYQLDEWAKDGNQYSHHEDESYGTLEKDVDVPPGDI